MPSSSPFRLLTPTLQMRVASTAQRFDLPRGFIPAEADSFWIENPNPFWVRFLGSGSATNSGSPMSGQYAEVIADPETANGRAIPPGFVGVFGTQFPRFMSLISAPYQGLAAGDGWVGLAWGVGS